VALDKNKTVSNLDHANFFWMGDLTIYEIANLQSFIKHGFKVIIWTYDKNLEKNTNLKEVCFKDANLVLNESLLMKFKQGRQKSSLSSFSNLFRYELLKKYGGWWFDMDCICLKNLDEFIKLTNNADFIIGRERENYTGSSVLYFNDVKILDELIQEVEFRAKQNDYSFFWGEIGPDLISEIILKNNLMNNTLDENYFYKISADKFHKFFENKINLMTDIEDSYVLHTWNEMFNRFLISKKRLPPKGSILYDHLNTSLDNLTQFKTSGLFFNLRFKKSIRILIKIIFRIKIMYKNYLT
jgi:hypothetical protein